MLEITDDICIMIINYYKELICNELEIEYADFEYLRFQYNGNLSPDTIVKIFIIRDKQIAEINITILKIIMTLRKIKLDNIYDS